MSSKLKLRKPKNPVKEGKNNGSEYFFSLGPIKIGKKHPVPNVEQEFLGTYENECIKDANSNINLIKNEFLSKDISFNSKCGKLSENYKSARALYEKETSEHLEVKVEFEEKRRLYESTRTHNNNMIYFWLVAILLTLAETAYNRIAFKILGESNNMTLIFAFTFSFIIGIGCKILGSLLKKRDREKADDIIMYSSVLILFGVLISLTYLREKYFESTGMSQELGIEMSHVTTSFVFFAINLGFSAILTFLAYLFSSDDPEREKIDQELAKKSHREFIDVSKKYEKEAAEALTATKNFDAVKEVFKKVHDERHSHLRLTHNSMEVEKNSWATVVATYRHHNLIARENRSTPRCFHVNIEDRIVIPEISIENDCSKCIYNSVFHS